MQDVEPLCCVTRNTTIPLGIGILRNATEISKPKLLESGQNTASLSLGTRTLLSGMGGGFQQVFRSNP